MGCGASKAKKEAEEQARKEEEARLAAAQKSAGGRKRGSVSAQGGMDPSKMKVNLNTMPKVQKSEEAVTRIMACVEKNFLFKSLSKEYIDAIVASMKEVTVAANESIIKQGDLGDFWYVVDKGALDAFKKGDEDAAPGKKVKSYAMGDSFGELALMYNQRRAASVIASEESVVWAVQQEVFKQLILSAANQNKQEYN